MFEIEFNNVRISVANRTLIDDLSASYKNVNCIHIIGNNGIGKSSLFKSLIGFRRFSYEGHFSVNNESNYKLNKFLYLPQECNSFININVGEYLATVHFESLNKNFLSWCKITTFHSIDWYSTLITRDYEEYLDLLNISPSDLLSNLNYSKKRFIELLRLPIKYNSIIFLDEPFEGMDNETLEIAISYLNKKIGNNAFLIIDHTGNYKSLNLIIKELFLNDSN